MPEITEWNSFYVIIGAAAGALIGLQFVAMTLITTRPVRGQEVAGAAFATPTIVHFTVALFLSAILSIPWHGIVAVSTIWGLAGFGGLIYAMMVTRRMRAQNIYRPVFEDWLFHVLLPIIAYGMLAVSAFVAHFHARSALFVVSAATLVFLFVGIHNSWDAVTYHIFTLRAKPAVPAADENKS